MKKTYEDTIKELSLMLMYLTRKQDDNEFCRYRELSWKGYDFDVIFTDASLHQANGKNIMLLGLDVLPEYRKQGLAHEIVFQYLRRESDRDRKMLVLTCLQNKVKFYEKVGFMDRGLSASTWGDEQWHEMTYAL